MRHTVYSLIRSHWKLVLSAAALILLVVVCLSEDKMSAFNGMILFYTLIGIIAYTDETYGLARQQHDQFLLSNRPWLYVEDITYDSHPTGLTVAILLVNAGRSPALYDAFIDRFAITPVWGEKEIVLDPIMDAAGASSVVYPFVEGKEETRYMIPLRFTEKQEEYFQPGCKLEIRLRLSYKALTSTEERKPFGFEATLIVPSLDEKKGIQVTGVSGVVAT